MDSLRRLFGITVAPSIVLHNGISQGDVAYAKAIALSDELLQHMREASDSNDSWRAVMADIWAQHNNVPFMTSVYEVVAEAKSAIDQDPNAQPNPPPTPEENKA